MSEKMILSAELSYKIDYILDQLKQKVQPTCIILTDISGQLLAFYARSKSIKVENLAALFASNMGATSEIANEVLETEGFEFNLHEGKSHSVFISKIGNSFLLAVVFNSDVPVGMIRLFTKRACKELSFLTTEFEQTVQTNQVQFFNENFTDELSQQFTELLKARTF